LLGQVGYAGSPGTNGTETGSHNSAQRLRALWDRFCLSRPLAAALAGLSGPVLLVDDRIDTGWTITVAAKLVREAGAPAVLPLALATIT
jgi:ATP-dependent DNA helicase RecQ